MDARKSSKKTKGAFKPSRTPATSPTPSLNERPQYKERVKSNPLAAPQISEQVKRQRHSQQPSRPRRESQASESSAGTVSSPPSSPLTTKRASHSSRDGSASEVQEVTLAVLGAAAVGKTTFVRCALDLKKPFTSQLASKKVSLEGKISIVRLLELRLEDVQVTAEEGLRWPGVVGDEKTPPIDGVLALYDVMEKSSVNRIPDILKALSKNSIPTVLVSAKCDNLFKDWEVDQEKVEAFCSSIKVEMFGTSITAPETHKRCISVMLRNVMLCRRDSTLPNRPQRPRAMTSNDSVYILNSLNPQETKSKHGRAASEIPTSVIRSVGTIIPSPQMSEVVYAGKAPGPQRRSREAVLNDVEKSKIVPERSRLLLEDSDEDTTPSGHDHVMNQPLYPERSSVSSQTSSASVSSNLTRAIVRPPVQTGDGEEERSAGVEATNARLSMPSNRPKDHEKEQGKTFEELVDQLLSRPMSKSDSKFATTFLCLYRKFAAPFALLTAIIDRFEDLNRQGLPYLTRVTGQLRFINILIDWISDYPGDFAHYMTRRTMTSFVQSLEASSEYALASQEINNYLDIVSEDDDTEWACSDRSRSRSDTMESFLTTSSVRSTASTLNADSPTLTADSSTEDIVDNTDPEKLTKQYTGVSATPSSRSSIHRSESQSTFQTLLNSVEDAKRQAQQLKPVPRIPLTKVQWHQFMELPEEQIARELTRIDWIMYCSIRPRDLIRHVSLSAEQKSKCKSLEHVNLMINHFNLVASWVANLILLRDKPKHRARALEKFMGVAWQLRYLNNYNSLGAIIAGINGTAVHRLSQTRELIPPQAQKQFMRLEILMGTQKGHFAYRLAYENTTTQRIPFLPLHRRDLVLAEQGNRTFLDSDNERINWAKFEIMGDVIIGIKKSQQVPYQHINRHEDIQRLVLEGRYCKDDERLYERSIQLEAPGAGEVQRKRFNWFQR